MNIPELPLVLVIWEDANTGNDDAVSLDNVDAYHKPTIVKTLGWLLKRDDRGVTVVNEFYDSVFRGRTYIPAKMIMEVVPYNLSKPRKGRYEKVVRNLPDTPIDSGGGAEGAEGG
jgi:hypothetical protein